jgi:hypothetical protein
LLCALRDSEAVRTPQGAKTAERICGAIAAVGFRLRCECEFHEPEHYRNDMKKLTGALALTIAAAALLTGCVPITYTRSVTVQKDAAGNITGRTETETISEAHSEGPKVKELQGPQTPFQYLK